MLSSKCALLISFFDLISGFYLGLHIFKENKYFLPVLEVYFGRIIKVLNISVGGSSSSITKNIIKFKIRKNISQIIFFKLKKISDIIAFKFSLKNINTIKLKNKIKIAHFAQFFEILNSQASFALLLYSFGLPSF